MFAQVYVYMPQLYIYAHSFTSCVCVCVWRPCASPLYNEIMRVGEAGEARQVTQQIGTKLLWPSLVPHAKHTHTHTHTVLTAQWNHCREERVCVVMIKKRVRAPTHTHEECVYTQTIAFILPLKWGNPYQRRRPLKRVWKMTLGN